MPVTHVKAAMGTIDDHDANSLLAVTGLRRRRGAFRVIGAELQVRVIGIPFLNALQTLPKSGF